jgi:hypothetical protein
MASVKKVPMTADEAETLALQGLTFLAGDSQRLTRFLSLTGITPVGLKAWASEPRLHTAVLDHLLTDESLLLVAASDLGVGPEAFAQARLVLAKGPAR